MNSAAPLLTDASRTSSTQDTNNCAQGVENHVNGDWGQHAQISTASTAGNWVDSGQNHIPSSVRLRFLGYIDGQAVAFVIPAMLVPAGAAGGAAPIISQQPQATTGIVGRTASFTVAATSSAPLTYKWQHNGANIVGANGATLTLTNLVLLDAGTYDCVVSNQYGFVVSNTVNLTVNAK